MVLEHLFPSLSTPHEDTARRQPSASQEGRPPPGNSISWHLDLVLYPQGRDLKGQEKSIQKSIETALNTIEPKTYYTKITFDTAFVHH